MNVKALKHARHLAWFILDWNNFYSPYSPAPPHLSQISIIKLCFDYTMKDLLSNYMVTPEPIFIHRWLFPTKIFRSQGCLYHLHLDYSWQRNKDDPTSHPPAQLVLAYRRHWRKTTWENYLFCLDCWLAALAEQSLDENKQKESWYSTIWNNCRAEYNAHVCWLSIGYLKPK